MVHLKDLQTVSAKTLQQLADNVNVARNLRDAFPHPYTIDDARFFLQLTLQGQVGHVFAIYNDDSFIGVGGVVPQKDIYRHNAEIGYWIGEPYWGKGYATEAVKLLVAYAFDNLELQRVYAGVFASNNASMRVLEKAGFKLEAVLKSTITKYGQLLDEYLYSVVRYSADAANLKKT